MSKGCFINNTWVETAEKLAVLSPWSGETVGEVSLAAAGEWEAAIAEAQKAFVTLKAFSSLERQQMLEKLADGVKARQEELAQTIVAEGGKPITYARGEMARGVLTLCLAAPGGHQNRGRGHTSRFDPTQPGSVGDNPALPSGSGFGHLSLQFPLQPGNPQGRPSPGRGQPHHHQAVFGHPFDRSQVSGNL
jgi:hypothetical protein